MEKEKQSEYNIKSFKDQEKQTLQLRYDNKVRHNLDKSLFMKTMDTWAKTGFPNEKKRKSVKRASSNYDLLIDEYENDIYDMEKARNSS
mmetsp:Transcript_41634/g.40011  ORF Transcript_41634/g.40011 Transcript_41634/m.40011 type:complete len:89 (+) Transcript_41634:91-357(+)